MDVKEGVVFIDISESDFVKKLFGVMNISCKAALHDEDEEKVKHMKQCVALIGDL